MIAIDIERLQALVRTVGEFHLSDRRMRRAQARMEHILAAGAPAEEEIRGYLRAVTAYFADFAREAQAHVHRVDRELKELYQRQFNLNAERGVAARRAEATQNVLDAIAHLAK